MLRDYRVSFDLACLFPGPFILSAAKDLHLRKKQILRCFAFRMKGTGKDWLLGMTGISMTGMDGPLGMTDIMAGG